MAAAILKFPENLLMTTKRLRMGLANDQGSNCIEILINLNQLGCPEKDLLIDPKPYKILPPKPYKVVPCLFKA